MKLKNRYFILRHGQTIYQTKKKNSTYPWPENLSVRLTKKGEEQIKKIAKFLKKKRIDLVFASDFFRTRQTAEIVAKELGISKINFDRKLRDINFGIYRGKTKKEFYQNFSNFEKRFKIRPKKGENWYDVKKRITDFIKEIDKKYRKKNILIVSHGDPLWLLEGIVKGFNKEDLVKQILEGKYIKTGELRKI